MGLYVGLHGCYTPVIVPWYAVQSLGQLTLFSSFLRRYCTDITNNHPHPLRTYFCTTSILQNNLSGNMHTYHALFPPPPPPPPPLQAVAHERHLHPPSFLRHLRNEADLIKIFLFHHLALSDSPPSIFFSSPPSNTPSPPRLM